MTSQGPSGRSDLRQRAIDALCEAFAEDALTVEEFERRVEAAHKAEDPTALRELLVDLPSAQRVPARQDSSSTEVASAPTLPRLPADSRDHSLPSIAAPSEVPERNFVVGVMGGGARRGRWIPARSTLAIGFMGGAEIDLREAIFPPGVSEISAFAMWGGIEIIVPPGVRVDVSGMGVMGGFDMRSTVAPTDHPDAPILRVKGFACMGGVDVQVRYPGESGRDAKKRLRHERKAQRRRLAESRSKLLGRGKDGIAD